MEFLTYSILWMIFLNTTKSFWTDFILIIISSVVLGELTRIIG